MAVPRAPSEHDRHLAFRCPSEHYERLRQIAQQADTSVSALLREAVEIIVSASEREGL